MAYNKETHKKETVILPKRLSDLVKEDSVKEFRSVSAQISFIIEQHYKRSNPDELENQNT